MATENSEGSDTQTPSDPAKAAAALRYMAEHESLELIQAETRRRKAVAGRNAAVKDILHAIRDVLAGRWGGPILLGVLALLGILLIGIFTLGGADLSLVTELAESAAHAWTGCPEEVP